MSQYQSQETILTHTLTDCSERQYSPLTVSELYELPDAGYITPFDNDDNESVILLEPAPIATPTPTPAQVDIQNPPPVPIKKRKIRRFTLEDDEEDSFWEKRPCILGRFEDFNVDIDDI